MKTKFSFLTAALCAAVFFSCQKQDIPNPDKHGDSMDGSVSLSFLTEAALTKAASNTNDGTLVNVQVLVFNTADELYRHYSLSSAEVEGRSCELKNFKVGTYSMYVVANGPDLSLTVGNRAELLSTAIELGGNNDPTVGFVMCGMREGVVVTADTSTPVTVEISRYVSRVTLSSIKNNLPKSFGSMTVNYAFLSNVAGNQTIAGNAATTVWYNRDGRKDEDSRDNGHIIGVGAYAASCPENTYADYSQTVSNGNSITSPKYFYAYPNSLNTRGNGFSDPYVPKATSLDLSVTFIVSGTQHTYYYNVPLQGTAAAPGILRNYDYDVKVIISGEGADEPGKWVEKGSISASITIKDWTDGASTNIEI
ncbi:MAG: FimB/Mfa2 family fimbrial subunit [Bacteroidales bacterium]|nr:FimB/Mfa2 family fimbrial subunit [Candidatus Cacconaster scatequi]